MTSLSTDVVVPELGQVVRWRDRVWAVNEVATAVGCHLFEVGYEEPTPSRLPLDIGQP